MAKRRRKKSGWTRGQFWTLVISLSIVAAACVLITISGQMSKPFLPTWTDIYTLLGGKEDTGPAPEGTLQVHAIDVGNADAILVQTGGRNMLIDAGERDDGDRVVDYLKAKKVDKLDIVVATHADADHIGGMKTVIENMEIGTFIMAFMPEGYEPTTKTYTGMLEALATRNVAITEAEVGAQYALGEARLHILGPAGEFEDKNNQSVVCKLVFGSQKFLFMGDAETEAEKALLQSGRISRPTCSRWGIMAAAPPPPTSCLRRWIQPMR